jgi:hypothetical protein
MAWLRLLRKTRCLIVDSEEEVVPLENAASLSPALFVESMARLLSATDKDMILTFEN